MNDRWIWVDAAVLRAVHEEQLLEHGGPGGTRDEGLFESALARPCHLANYGDPDAAALAAAYGYGIACNHPFVDGNKRTSFVAIELFLDLNCFTLTASDADCVITILKLAGGELTEEALAARIREHTAEIGQG